MLARSHLDLLAMLLPGTMRMGAVRFPVFGLMAAGGLVVAMLASQPSARRAGVAPEKAWDAGLFAIMAGFLASRLLLVVRDPKTFVRYPILVLSLPSLTWLGLGVAGVATLIYLLRRRAPLLPMLDAWAVPGALLAAILEVAHWFEGTDAGMPSHMPWALRSPGDSVLGPVEPVQLFAAFAALILAATLWRLLRPARHPGSVAALAMLVGGLLAFGLDQLRQPLETYGDSLLEPGEWIALASTLIGAALLTLRFEMPTLTRAEAAEILENFVTGRGGPHDHELLEHGGTDDALIVEARERFIVLPNEFPPEPGSRAYSNPQGAQVLLDYAHKLRNSAEKPMPEAR